MDERGSVSGEAEAIDRVDEPATVDSLADDLRALGVSAGDTLLVHSSLSSIGWVAGAAQGVVEALQQVLTDAGTLVMPTHSPQFTDPAGWEHPPVPDDWVEVIRTERPPYRPDVTPTRGMGAIPECFRDYPGVVRSRHPEFSFAAWGAGAEAVVADHSFDDGLGEGSPLARVYDRDGRILLLGVGHDRNTSLHLAEYRAAIELGRISNRVRVVDEEGHVRWVAFEDIEVDSDDFDDLGAAYEAEVGLTVGSVGAAESRLVSQRAMVDYAVGWLESHR